MKVGDCVSYVDELGVAHPALVTAVWDNGEPEKYPNPSINVVYVSGDESQHDQYGRQITRQTSTVHKTNQAAHGRYWSKLQTV